MRESSLKWKKILLIMPNYRMREANRFIQRIYPPIGLMYIASYLSDLNVEVKIIDAKLLQYAFKHHAYHKNITGFISRIIKARGFTSVFNPKRIISTIFTVLKANISLNKFFN